MTIGEKIKRLRKKRGLTQKQLAQDANIAVISLQQYESNKRIPSTKQLIKIANAFLVPVDFFVSDWEENLKPENWKTTEEERETIKREHELIRNYKILNNLGKKEALKRVEELTEIKKYTEPDQ